MCLTTNDPTIYIAEEDIVVFKQLDEHKYYNRERNLLEKLFRLNRFRKTYHPQISSHIEYKLDIVNPRQHICPSTPYTIYDEMFYDVDAGYHSDVNPRQHHNAKFIIPKGTKYIKGWYNDEPDRLNYVSETIIFKEVLNAKKLKKILKKN